MRSNNLSLLFITIIVLFLSMVLSLLLGSVGINPISLISSLLKGERNTETSIFIYSRLPRTIASISAGFALALSGAMLQSVLGNRLAAPGIIGVNSGAGLMVVIAFVLGAVSPWTISVSAFLGALVSSLFVVVLSRKIRAGRSTLLLAGVSLNYIFGALSDVLCTLYPKETAMSGDFKVGGFSSVSMPRLIPAVVLIAIASIIAFGFSKDLEVLSLGDDEASSLGMNTKRMRLVFIVLSSILAGAAVSFAGLMGFVGLLIPNGVRWVIKGDSSYYLPLSAISGAAFVTLSDTLSRIIFSPYEVPVGVILALIGGPVFLYMVIRGRR
ncbi:MAG: FecCD family ABC transporter permease [Candidatus Ornithospirochaeta sp.]